MGEEGRLGVAALEDKLVQRAVVEVLNAIYEQDFLGFYTDFDRDAASTMHWTHSQLGLRIRR